LKGQVWEEINCPFLLSKEDTFITPRNSDDPEYNENEKLVGGNEKHTSSPSVGTTFIVQAGK
jgi:hypothetical protein